MYEQWVDIAWRSRVAKTSHKTGEHIERCFDYANFNSQHSLLQLWFVQMMWRANGTETEVLTGAWSHWNEVLSYVTLGTLRQSIKWFNGHMSALLSGLGSGIRRKTEVNSWSSIEYEGVTSLTCGSLTDWLRARGFPIPER
eukprot:1246355-Amphidinium_carterae.1